MSLDSTFLARKSAISISKNGGIPVNYRKPHFTFQGKAARAVCGTAYKILALLVDAQNIPWLITFAAYEADE